MLERRALQFRRRGDDGRFKIRQIQDKVVGVAWNNPKCSERLLREVLQVRCHDLLGAGENRGGQNMSIIGIGQRQLVDQVLVAGDQAIRDGLVHQGDRPRKPGFIELRAVAQESGHPFALNIRGPPGAKAARLSQTDHQIPEGCRIEQACVINNGERRHSVPQAQFLGLSGQLIRRFGTFPIDSVAIIHQIRKANPTMSTHFVERDFTSL